MESLVGERSHIVITETLGHNTLRHWMVDSAFRGYVITRIKAPLQNVLEAGKSFAEVMTTACKVMARLPEFGRNNLVFPTSVLLKEKADKLLSYHHNPSREKMLEAGVKLLLAEYEHDDYYAFLIDYLVIELAIEVLKGNYKPKRLKFPAPLSACWSGGDLPDRAAILKLVKEELRCQT